MRTLIFEPNSSGHRLHHVRLIADALLALGHKVEIALPLDADTSREFEAHLSEMSPTIWQIDYHDPPQGGAWKAAGRRLRALSDVISKLEPDHVYVPYADGMTQRAAIEAKLRGHPRWSNTFVEGLHLRGRFAYPTPNRRSRVVARSSQSLISRAPWDYLHLLDPLVYEYLKGLPHLPRGEPRFDLIPEPVEAGLDGPKTEARDRLGLDPVASYVGCVGAIDTRKGVDRLLNAFSRGLGANVKLLLVGQHDPAIRKALGGDFAAAVRAGSIVSRDDYVAQRQFADAITSCDVLALPYRAQVGSSGLLVRAAAARRPVVTSNYGWLGECVRRFDLGATCDTSNPDQFAAAIAGALTRSSPLALTERAHRFVKFNTEANFKEVWTRQIRLRAGKSPQSSHLTWAWVMFGETQAWNE